MANTVIGASVEVEFESIGQVRKAIKDATSDLLRMQEAFGKTSPQAIDAAKRVADLRDRINDAKEQADLFDPGNKFKAFSNAASQVAAGFSAVQGAMALAGSESEDLQKTLVRVQGAMALSQGLSQIADLGKAYEELKIVAVNAFKSIRAAIGATGIGLLVIALGTIVAYWDDIKAAVSGVSEEQKKLNKESQKNLDAQKEKLDAISGQENILKLQGKSEKDILKLKLAQTDETIKAAEVNLKNNIETKKAQVAAAKRNKEILQGLIAFVSLPITAVLKGIDLIGQAVGKNFDLYGKFSGGLASLVFDPEKTEKEGAEDIKAQKKALDDLKNQRAGYELSLKEIDKKANDERKAAAQKNADERKNIENQITEFLEKEYEKRNNIGKDQFEIDIENTRKLFDEKIALAKKYNIDTEALEMARFSAIGGIINKENELRKNILDKSLGDFKSQVPKIATLDGKITVNAATEANTRKQIAQDEAENRIILSQEIGNALSALSDVVGRETVAGKALAIAQATINTFLGITEVWKSKAVLPEPFNTATKIAATVTTAAGGFAAVRNIAKTKVPGGGGSGAPATPTMQTTAPLTPAPSAAVQGQALNAQAINNLGNNAMRAYVLNSDIQNNDQRNAYLQRNARIG